MNWLQLKIEVIEKEKVELNNSDLDLGDAKLPTLVWNVPKLLKYWKPEWSN